MKKTLIINIGNSIIHIEEDAYEILTAYLNEIKQHFAKNADDFEIVTDIENRVAEMFAEILANAKKQVIEIADVQSVVAQMGSVKDFEIDELEEATNAFEPEQFSGAKKLYRDTDDGVIAGVCAGLGHYLNVEARRVRLVAFLTIFLGGAGFIAYIILWISMPRAVSRSEKMEMKGEATNLYGYNKSFEDELAMFKEKMKSANAEFGPAVKRSGNFITEIVQACGRLISSIVKVAGKIIAGCFILLGFGLMVGAIVTTAALMGFGEQDAFESFPFSIINEGYRNEIILAAFVTAFIPVLVLVLFAIRVVFNKRALNKTLSFSLLIVWLIGASYSIYYAAKITSEFKEHAKLVKNIDLKSYPTYVIDIDRKMAFSKADSTAFNILENHSDRMVVFDDNDDHPFRTPKNIRIEFEKSENEKTSMIQTFESQGKNFPIALRNAQNIKYDYVQKDSLLTLSPRLALKDESKWRGQQVLLTIKVPVGTRVLLNDSIYDYLNFYHFYCDDYDKRDSVYREWIMTEEGLKCKAELEKARLEVNP
ncbi:MAG: PspC domain-containing protein [Flavobacterium sp.]|nr:MAG: PspC domain-containing protein [Flavobacterium sp.]